MNIDNLHEGLYEPPPPPPLDLADLGPPPPLIRQHADDYGSQNLYYFDENNRLQMVPDLLVEMIVPPFDTVPVIEEINIEPGYKIVWYRSNAHNIHNPIAINHERNICVAFREFHRFILSRRVVVNMNAPLLLDRENPNPNHDHDDNEMRKKYNKYKNKYNKLKEISIIN